MSGRGAATNTTFSELESRGAAPAPLRGPIASFPNAFAAGSRLRDLCRSFLTRSSAIR